ncbi:DUF2975 domain-containing protein [Pedobacter duraquae]|uniref:DUF2975 family protein n=1 Tax=Pedobacter duraquae TaxID=425511 RepID=A0A4R6IGH5_9SPHI|nr:DUF2975 domain-containing protein [Pedobacter duraquae]TDO20055.1 Protein of unknown function (DUF2975) [Pedobacter duraquae]
MQTVRLISRLLFIITRAAAVGYLLSFLLSAAALSTGWSLNIIENGSRFQVCYPFTAEPYLLGENNRGYILGFLMLLGLYALFFYLVGNVFRVFTHEKLFTKEGIRHLKIFYLGNLVLPVLAVIIIAPFYPVYNEMKILVVLHALLGVFSYFISAIFTQGVKLQHEQDLII